MFDPNLQMVEELEFLMRELSELWCAGWMSEVEFALWDAVQGNPDWAGQVQIADNDVLTAKRLSEEIQGWVTYPDDWEQPGYISMTDWQETLSRRAAKI